MRWLLMLLGLCAFAVTPATASFADESDRVVHWFFGKDGRVDKFNVNGVEIKLRYNYAVDVDPGRYALITGWWKAESYGHVLNENRKHTPIYIDLRNGNTSLEHEWAIAPRLLAKTGIELANGGVYVTFSIGGQVLFEGGVRVPALVVGGGSTGNPHPGTSGPQPPPHVGAGILGSPGSVFRTQTSEFVFTGRDEVVENRFNGPRSKFEVTERGPTYVELYDADRNMYVRLTKTQGLWRAAESEEWNAWPGSDGRWVAR